MKKLLRLLTIAGTLALSPAIAAAGGFSDRSPAGPGPERGVALQCRDDRGDRERERERERERHHRHHRHHHHGHEHDRR